PPAPPPPVNMFRGVVFPAPHDPRWRLGAPDSEGRDVFLFGDSDIILGPGFLGIGRHLVSDGVAALAYYAAVGRARTEFAQTLALQRVEPAIMWAGYGADGLRARP